MNEKKLILVLTIFFVLSMIVYCIPVRYSRYVIDEEPVITTPPRFETVFNTDITPLSLSDREGENLKVILINLKRRKDRLHKFMSLYNSSDLVGNTDLYKIEAVNGKEKLQCIIPVLSENALKEFEVYKRFNKRVGHHSLTEGGMGCYMSHIIAWKHVKNFGAPCVVAEDDVILSKDTYSNLYNFVKKIEEIPKSRPYIILFHSICKDLSWDKLECVPISNDVYNAKQFWSTAFYYVTPDSVDVLLEHSFPIKYQIDHMMSTMSKRELIDIYFIKDIVRTPTGDTDIQVPLL